MLHSQGTQVQKWSKGGSITVASLVILVHIASVVLVLLYCPELLESDAYEGVHCETNTNRLNSSCEGCDDNNNECIVRSDGEMVSLSNIILSYRFPHKPKLSYWNWKLTASLSIYLKVYGNDLISKHSNTTDLSELQDLSQQVSLSGSIDYALNKNLAESDSDSTIPSSAWHSKARARNVNRTLNCNLMQIPVESEINNENVLYERELPFLCTLIPTVEVYPLSNSTYIISLHLDSIDIAEDNIDLMNTNATVASQLTVISESDLFHQLKFYMKCTFSPIILFCLIWFLIKLCFNDLYVNIPDRLIITASVVQILGNIPTDLIFSSLAVPHMLLVDPVSQVVTFTVLAAFWIIFTLDKLADNEPWERHTKYYWRSLLLILLGRSFSLLIFYMLIRIPFALL